MQRCLVSRPRSCRRVRGQEREKAYLVRSASASVALAHIAPRPKLPTTTTPASCLDAAKAQGQLPRPTRPAARTATHALPPSADAITPRSSPGGASESEPKTKTTGSAPGASGAPAATV